MLNLTKKQKILVLAVPVLVIGYLIFREIKKGKTTTPPDDSGAGNTPPNTNNFTKYLVKTSGGNLNIRSTPSTTQSPIGTLPNGTEIFARKSNTTGWHEYSENGTTGVGYVSSQYVVAK